MKIYKNFSFCNSAKVLVDLYYYYEFVEKVGGGYWKILKLEFHDNSFMKLESFQDPYFNLYNNKKRYEITEKQFKSKLKEVKQFINEF